MENKAKPPEPEGADVQLELLECLNKLGKIMLASSNSIGTVRATLEDVAAAYGFPSEIVAFPNLLIIKLGDSTSSVLDITTQPANALMLNQTSDLASLIEKMLHGQIQPGEASGQIDRILEKRPRFGRPMILFGYVLAVMGLTLRLQPRLETVLISAFLGLLAGLVLIGMQRWPRYQIFAPVVAAMVVSTPTFLLIKAGYITGASYLIIPPLAGFLPGAILTIAMIELASSDIISGSSRLIYGFSTLLLLYVGIGAAARFAGVDNLAFVEFPEQGIPMWAAILGTTLFGVGNFIRLSGRNKDLLWILLVLFLAMLGQVTGESFFNAYGGAFLGAFVLALSSEIIGRSPNRTPAFVSQTLAFWFLVPGSSALLSVTRLLDTEYIYGNFGMNELILLIVAVSLGILLGTILATPRSNPKKNLPAGQA